MRLFLCLKGSDKFEQEVFEALYGNQSRRTAQTYIFLVDNQDIALNIVMSGYQAICLVQEDDGYYFSADSFIEEMRSIQFYWKLSECLSLCGRLYSEVDE